MSCVRHTKHLAQLNANTCHNARAYNPTPICNKWLSHVYTLQSLISSDADTCHNIWYLEGFQVSLRVLIRESPCYEAAHLIKLRVMRVYNGAHCVPQMGVIKNNVKRSIQMMTRGTHLLCYVFKSPSKGGNDWLWFGHVAVHSILLHDAGSLVLRHKPYCVMSCLGFPQFRCLNGDET